MKNADQLWDTVQQRVCSHCIDSSAKGACRLPADQECGLRRHFSSIVTTVLAVHSDSLGPYVNALREHVCSLCDHQTLDGQCVVRNEVECGLDRYFPMIVEVIERLGGTDRGTLKEYAEAP